MTEAKKQKGKRPPTAATLYRHITEYLPIADVNSQQPIQDLLDSLRDRIVEEAIR